MPTSIAITSSASLNADKPLDRFIIEQLAGDELVPRPWSNLKPDQAETLAATGFLRTAVDGTSTGAPDEALAANQVVADTLKIVGSTFLGLTVGCAQCHDHRYDPIPQSDYYRLRAVFEPALNPQQWRRPGSRLVSLYTDADRAKAAAIEAEAQKLAKAIDAKTQKYLAEALEKELTKFPQEIRGKLRDAYKTPEGKRLGRTETAAGRQSQREYQCGDPLSVQSGGGRRPEKGPGEGRRGAGQEAGRGLRERARRGARRAARDADLPPRRPSTTDAAGRGRGPDDRGAGRAAIRSPRARIPGCPPRADASRIARHLVDGRHPLVGRVLANRIWLHHFGRGLVDTPGDFGVLGNRPTHPELLDWLADELVRQGWSLKRMHRLIMTSAAYRQSSRRDPADGTPDSDDPGTADIRSGVSTPRRCATGSSS